MATHGTVLPLGYTFEFDPIPPRPESTISVPAGPIRIDIEARTLSDALIGEMYADNQKALARINEIRGDLGPTDYGVSLHVFDDGHNLEHIRFDIFELDPHYHYLSPGNWNISIPFDTNANGDMYEWAILCLERRASEMISFAGNQDLASRLDSDLLKTAIPTVRDVYRQQLLVVEASR